MDDEEAGRLAREDGYVTCDECGHMMERHDTTGCQTAIDGGCPCQVRVTQTEIRAIRVRYGLPARFDRNLLMP